MNTPTPLVTVEINEGVACLTLARADKRNALTSELIANLADAVAGVRADSSARLLVLRAEGPVFCAGMDLAEMQQRAASPDARQLWRADTESYRNLLVAIWSLPIPTLAVVQGPALAGGVGLVLACDMVLASQEAFFALPEPKRGITAAIVAPLLIYRAGTGPAAYLLLSGEAIRAEEAQRWNMCHVVVPGDLLQRRREELAESILAAAPSALKRTKEHIINTAGTELLRQLDDAVTISAEARETEDAREGLAAFLEKRDPDWLPRNSP